MLRSLLLALALASPAMAEPVLRGLDHMPVAVADLERARIDYEALGFVLKPGQPHRNGIRNVHAKFPDGTEIELITAAAATDALTAEYVAWIKDGDGAPFVGFFAPDMIELLSRISDLGSPTTLENGLASFPEASLLHHLLFAGRQRSPTDRPEHFAHPNTALGLAGVWLAGDVVAETLLRQLDAAPSAAPGCAPFGASVARLTLPEGEIAFVRSSPPSARPILGATVAVRSLEAARRVLTEKNVGYVELACARDSLWVAPAKAHGIWLEFRQKPG